MLLLQELYILFFYKNYISYITTLICSAKGGTETEEKYVRLSDEDIQKARDVPIEDVVMATRLGTEIDRKTKKFHCLDPNHVDKDPSCGIWKRKNVCRCFSCGKVFDTIEVIRAVEGRDFKDAVIRLSEIGGFTIEGMSEAESEQRVMLPTRAELEFLGIKTERVDVPFKVYPDRPPKGDYMREENGDYIWLKPADFNPMAMLTADPDTFYMLIRGKALEKYRSLEPLFKKLKQGEYGEFLTICCPYVDDSTGIVSKDDIERFRNELMDTLKDDLKKCKDLMLRYSGKAKKMKGRR